MIIKSVELNNFSIYKGHNCIDLSVSDKENIVIVSGKNGYGKTTFLMALVWCLYGKQMKEVDEIYKQEINNNGGYYKYMDSSLNTQVKEERETIFSVQITFKEVNIPEIPCQTLTIKRVYDTERQKEKLDILLDGHEDELIQNYEKNSEGNYGKELFINEFIMPKEIAKFFFFDAEKIVSLPQTQANEQRIKTSRDYSEALGIKLYEDLRETLEFCFLDLNKRGNKTDKQTEELNKLESQLNTSHRNINILKGDIKVLNQKHEEHKDIISQLQHKLIKKGNFITTDELNDLEKKKKEYSDIRDKKKEALTHYYTKIPFAISASLLVDVLEQVHAEREAENRKYDKDKNEDIRDAIINDLDSLPKPENIIITYGVKNFFIEKLKPIIIKHLNDSFSAKNSAHDSNMKPIHHFSEFEKNRLDKFINSLKTSFRIEFKKIRDEYVATHNKYRKISSEINKAATQKEDDTSKADRERKESLEKENEKIKEIIGQKKREIDEKNKAIKEINKDIFLKSKGIRKGNEDKQKAAKIAETLEIIKNFIAKFKNEKKASLARRIKESLQGLLHKKDLIDDVEIGIIDKAIDIDLKNNKGSVINKDSLSKGEQQMYATALLKGLIDESGIDFPVFIDSPMQKFDVDHASSIIKNFYPNVSKQVIIFPLLEKEMNKKEFQVLLPNIQKTFLIKNKNNQSSVFEEIKPKEHLFSIFEK